MTEPLDIWTRVERSYQTLHPAVPTAAPTAEAGDDSGDGARKRLWIRRCIDVLALLVWSYAILKLFVFDVDRALLRSVAPGWLGVLDYRFLFYLGVAAVIVALRNRWVYLGAAYVVFFPFVLLFWKLPKFFYKRRSWTVLLGAMNAAFSVLSDFRYHFLTKAGAFVAGLIILVHGPDWMVRLSAGYIFGLVIWSIARTTRNALRPSAFLRAQREKIGRLLDSERLHKMISIDDELKSENIELYSQTQLNTFTTNLSLGIFINRGLYFWAYQLERYRKTSAAPVLLAGLAYIWLLLGTTLGLALTNYAVLQVAPEQYSFDTTPSFIAVVVYSLNSLALSDGGGFQAAGDVANLLRIFAGLAGFVFLASFFLNIVVAFRRQREDAAMRDTIEELKGRARKQEEMLRNEYAVGIDEARTRLDQLGAGLSWLIGFLTIPRDFFDPNGR